MKRAGLMKLLAGTLAAVMIVSVPVTAAEQAAGAQGTNIEAADAGNSETVSDGGDALTYGEDAGSETPKETDPADAAGNHDSTDAPAETPSDKKDDTDASPSDEAENRDPEEVSKIPDGEAEKTTEETPEISDASGEDGTEDESGELPDEADEADAWEAGDPFAAFEEEPDPNLVGSGKIDAEYGKIDWRLDKAGFLTVEGQGDYCNPADAGSKAPWLAAEYITQIVSAQISLKSDCTKLDHLFDGCINLTEADLSGTNAEKVTGDASAADMFKDCSALLKVVTPQNVKIETMLLPDAGAGNAWFLNAGAQIVTALPKEAESQTIYNNIGGKTEYAGTLTWRIDDEKNLIVSGTGNYMDPAAADGKAPWLDHREKFTSARIDLAGSTTFKGMFEGCAELGEVLFAATCDTSKVTEIGSMFADCARLEVLDLSMFDLSLMTNCEKVFEGCAGLKYIQAPKNVKAEIALPVSESYPVWYQKNITKTKVIPVGTESIDLYRSVTQISLHDVQGGLNRYYAELAGVDPDSSKLVKGDIWVAGFKEALEYTGYGLKQDVWVYDKARPLNKNEFSLSYKNNVNVADKDQAADKKKPQMIVKLKGQYAGSRPVYFSIVPADINNVDVIDNTKGTAVSYTGRKQEINPKLTFNKKTLKKKTHYTVTYEGDTTGSSTGFCEVKYTIQGTGNFTGTKEGTYFIVGADHNLSKGTVTFDKTVKYDGTPIPVEKLVAALKVKGNVIDPSDYDVRWKTSDPARDPKIISDVGTYTIIIEPSEAGAAAFYMGRLQKTFKVVGAVNFKTAGLNGEVWKDAIPYNKTAANTFRGIVQADGVLMDGSTVLHEDADYTVTYAKNKKAGTARATFRGLGKYNGTFSKTFKITPAEEKPIVTVPEEVEYAKNGAVPSIVVLDAEGAETLIEKTDYTVKLKNNKAVGTATCTVKGKGNYRFEETKTFTVVPGVLTDECLTAVDRAYKNTRTAYKSTPVLYDRQNGKKLKAGTDYEKTFLYQKQQEGETYEPIAEGEIPVAGDVIRITVTGKGNYAGTCSTNYRIYDKTYDISRLYVAIDPQIYDREGVEPVLSTGNDEGDIHVYLSEIDMYSDMNEVNATEYVKIVSYANNRKVGTGSVTLRAFGEFGEGKEKKIYGGQKTYSFTIQPKSVAIVGVSSVTVRTATERYAKLNSGESVQMFASVLPKNADNPNSTGISNDAEEWKFDWSTDDPRIATVDQNGKVTGVKSGYTYVNATVKDAKGKKVKGSCRVFVDMKVLVVDKAVPNVAQDQSSYFNACITAANAANVVNKKAVKEEERVIVWVLGGTYSIDVNAGKKIQMKSYVTLHMDDKAVLKALPTSKADYCMVSFSGVYHSKIEGGKIVGTTSGGAGGHCVGIYNSCTYITVDNVDISGGSGDGIHVANQRKAVSHISLYKCKVHSNRTNNIGIESGDTIAIEKCDLWSHATGDGLRIGSDDANNPVSKVTVTGCVLSGSTNYAVAIPKPSYNITFKGCKINGSAYNGGCGNLLFDGCKISEELLERNDSKYGHFAFAKFSNMDLKTDIGKHTQIK